MPAGPADEPPGWFRDEPFADGADAASDRAPTRTDGKAGPDGATAGIEAIAAGEAAAAPAASAEPEPADVPDGSAEDDDLESASHPGTIYRTAPPLPEDAAARPRRRSPIVSVLLGLLILVVVGAGGFGIGMLLPLLVPLPGGDTAVVSPAPSGTAPAASPVPSAGASPTPAASPSSPASAAPTPTATARIYVVVRGDQLGRIAASFGVTLQALEAANGIANPNLIIPGQKLVIPPPSASPGASTTAAPSAPPSAAP
jgi:LysM repeat protein